MGKIFDLFSDISEEGVCGPAAGEHDGEGWDAVKIH